MKPDLSKVLSWQPVGRHLQARPGTIVRNSWQTRRRSPFAHQMIRTAVLIPVTVVSRGLASGVAIVPDRQGQPSARSTMSWWARSFSYHQILEEAGGGFHHAA